MRQLDRNGTNETMIYISPCETRLNFLFLQKPGANSSMNRVFISKYPIMGDLDATFIGPGSFKKDAPALQQVVLSVSQPRKARRNQCAHLLRHQKFLTALARLSYNSNPDLAVYELHFLVISHPIILVSHILYYKITKNHINSIQQESF